LDMQPKDLIEYVEDQGEKRHCIVFIDFIESALCKEIRFTKKANFKCKVLACFTRVYILCTFYLYIFLA
ncbi:hypothetical protein, partial [Helicobacter typhlonius]|uniref:hypothetical protein n=1 Tax=Helicobacter typhlonius TaxID=76936 RepID=UPI002FE37003